MTSIRVGLAGLVLALTIVVVGAPAGATVTTMTIDKCLSGKVKALGKSVSARTKCFSKDASTGVPDPSCQQKASDKFTGDGTPANGAFNKLEARYPNTSTTPCLTFGDQGPFESEIASYAASVPAATGSAVGRCDAAKIKCVGKYVAAVTSCYAKAAKLTGTIDPACTGKASAKLVGGGAGCLDKAAAKADCTHAGNQSTVLQGAADAFIRSRTCDLDPANPGCGCPTTYTFTANGSDADFDVGWTGINHDGDMPSMSRLTFGVSGCPNTVSPCGTCALSGPVANPGGVPFTNRRCRGDDSGANGSWIECASDGDCAGTGNACVFFFGPPRPDHLGFGELCTVTEIGATTGNVDPDAGNVIMTAPVTTRSSIGISIDDPCPLCTGGFCSSGIRNGQPCTVQGHSTSFDDDVSLDCPLSPAVLIATQTVLLTLGTGAQAVTLGSGNPPCTATGFTGDRCFCDTCNNGNAEPCTSDATCPPSGGNPGVCGGKRCLGGSNVGAPCASSSECPGGTCSRPGTPTAPNPCDDGICTPNTPPDTDSANEGTCANGPFETFCGMQPYRPCTTPADCPIPGDTCFGKFRDCFTTNGLPGDAVSATGQVSPTAPTLATLYCGSPTPSTTVNAIRGLPGLVRLTIPGVATTD